jgi:hypothetical protein
VKIHGTWTPTEGDYEMSLHTANPTSLFIDGKETLWARYHDGMTDRKVTLHLGPGGHSVDLVTFFSHDLQVPAMVVHSLKEGWIRPLDELVP